MKHFSVTGMSCAACSARVEKAVCALNNVEECAVNLLTNSMTVRGDVSADAVIRAVENAGYGAFVNDGDQTTSQKTSVPKTDAFSDRETPILKKRLYSSVIFLLILMYGSMGYVMWGFPLPSVLSGNPVAIGLTELLLTTAVMVINQKFFLNGFKGLLRGSPNMDTLVALGSAAAFLYSTCVLFMMTGSTHEAAHLLHELYFESAAMILTLITVGKMLEARSKGKTTDALKSLMKLAPKTATLYKDGTETEIPAEALQVGDIFVVRPGESIPTDGKVIYGHSAVVEAALTGESIPADKQEGDTVSGATINTSGYLRCQATHVGQDTALAKIIRTVTDASSGKAPIAKVADKVSGIFVPVVMAIAVLTTMIWLGVGETFGFALARGISVLVISCPCALGLATPVAIMVASGVGAKNGILFKTAASLEETGRIKTVVLDKTGTITTGTPQVTDILTFDNTEEKDLLTKAFSLEKHSEHPLAKAIVQEGERKSLETFAVSDFETLPGNGLKGIIDGKLVCGGNLSFVAGYAVIPDVVRNAAEELANAGKTPLYFSFDGKLLGMIAVSDTIKPDSREAVQALKGMGLHVVMLTGDNPSTASAMANAAGIDEVIAGVDPFGKQAAIKELCKSGKVAMVGDGINDAPALTNAHIGIAIGAGTDVAVDAAEVVLMKSQLRDVPAAIRLSRKTLRTVHENLFWAFIYNVIGIPLAAGVFIPVLDWQLNPMFGAAAMSLSSFCVVSNALRINFFKLYRFHRPKNNMNTDLQIKYRNKEKKTMTKTMKIEGMMCAHCEARVKKILEETAGVTGAEVSHEKGTAVLTLSADVSNELLKKMIEEQGYSVLAID